MAAPVSKPTSCTGGPVIEFTSLIESPFPLALTLRSMPVAARALMVGAHPDDEDSALLADLVLRRGVRTSYLSLTRGEGGQNCLGPEAGAALGVLRTGELMASRRYDGAEQLFSPCVDFGYAKRAEDAFAHWPRQQVVGSIVQAIRYLQPDVVISIWTGSRIDGHGHHQASGDATREAFELAGDAAAYPEHLEAGLAPWRPKRLLVRVRDVAHQTPDDLHINVGAFDPALGRSCFEVAMHGRSLHRSQNMGALPLKGTQTVVYRVAAGSPTAGGQGGDPLRGLPQRLDAWAQACPQEHPGAEAAIVSAVRRLDEAWQRYHPQRPERTAPCLAAALGDLAKGMRLLGGEPTALQNRLRECRRRVEAAWLQAHGLVLEVLAEKPEVVAGGKVEVQSELFVRGNADIVLSSLQARAGSGWQVERLEGPAQPVEVRSGTGVKARFILTAPQDEATAVASTLPPWLRLPPEGDMYRFEEALPCLAAAALPALVIQAKLSACEPQSACEPDPEIRLSAPVVWRELDPARGELRQPLRVRPNVTFNVSPSLIVLPASGAAPPTIDVQLGGRAAMRGRLIVRACDDPSESQCSALSLRAGEERTVQLTLPAVSGASSRRVYGVELQDPGAEEGEAGYASRLKSWQDVRYPHIEPGYVLAPAEVCVSVVAADAPPGLRVGYLPGTGDGVAEALKALGVGFRTLRRTTCRTATWRSSRRSSWGCGLSKRARRWPRYASGCGTTRAPAARS